MASSALEQPKQPVGGAFGIFMSEKRPEYLQALPGKRASEVSKMGGEAWKKLSDEEKASYQKKYEEKKAKYDKDMADFLAAGGEKTKGTRALRTAKKMEKVLKKNKDANMPKKPAGGAYGVWLSENREAIVKSMPEGHKMTDVTKEASKKWSALSDDDKKPYQEKFLKKQEEYKVAFEEYKKTLPADEPADEEDKENTPKKRKAAGAREGTSPPKKAKITPPKKQAKAPKNAKPQAPTIDADVLKKAEGLGLEQALKNLMSRSDVMAKDFPQEKLLSALEESEGLVNKAKYTLLGA